ncbi:glycosyltransferase family 39 protein [Arhodomonas sp. AD133]|uniref:glycosyltransferase family 39 protein n=1 Tax=Arhodomonas sp. AD133 TaxID=3415009 RepID=UPI003EBC277B
MAGAVGIFGESEWAMRLPSALVGVVSTLLAFSLGRRFLTPTYNVAFVAVIAFTPALIEVSQTARMYIFYIAAAMAFALAVFRWESTGSWRAALGALAIMVIALEFHPLAIFAVPVAAYPLVTRPGPRRLIQALVVCCGSVLAFYLVRTWHAMNYDFGRLDDRQLAETGGLTPETLSLGWPSVAISIGIAAFGIYWIVSRVRNGSERPHTKPLVFGATALLILSLLCAVAASYHLVALTYAVAAALLLRTGGWWQTLAGTAVALAMILAAQGTALMAGGDGQSLKEVVKYLIILPSPVPYFRFAYYFPAAVLAYAVVLLFLVVRFIRGAYLPAHVLFFVLAVWVPLVGIGFFEWNVPPRYTIGFVPFFALCFLAAAQSFQAIVVTRGTMGKGAHSWRVVSAVVAVALLVHPAQLPEAMSRTYAHHPDHKGAAAFMQQLAIGPADIVIAEDVLQQTYYLGRVDYWLRHMRDARPFLRRNGEALVDWYTGTRVIADGDTFREILSRPGRGAVYVIGEAEGYQGRDYRLGEAIIRQFRDFDNEVIYTGRDAVTRIWRFPPFPKSTRHAEAPRTRDPLAGLGR